MCLFSTPSAPSVPPPSPPPEPAPIPTPAVTNPIQTADAQRNQVAALRYGLAATVRTSGQGITGAGPDLNTPSASGSMYPTMGTKKTTGS